MQGGGLFNNHQGFHVDPSEFLPPQDEPALYERLDAMQENMDKRLDIAEKNASFSKYVSIISIALSIIAVIVAIAK